MRQKCYKFRHLISRLYFATKSNALKCLITELFYKKYNCRIFKTMYCRLQYSAAETEIDNRINVYLAECLYHSAFIASKIFFC